jgi:hypothetical protein
MAPRHSLWLRTSWHNHTQAQSDENQGQLQHSTPESTSTQDDIGAPNILPTMQYNNLPGTSEIFISYTSLNIWFKTYLLLS